MRCVLESGKHNLQYGSGIFEFCDQVIGYLVLVDNLKLHISTLYGFGVNWQRQSVPKM